MPRNCTHSFIAALVYGGPLEQIHVISETTASVKFLHPADCTKYYEATSNGLVYKKDLQGRELAVFVELAKDVDVIGGLLQSWIDTGVTRCVRAVGVDEEWDMATLVKLASGKGRILAGISDEKLPSGVSAMRVPCCSYIETDPSHAVSSSALQRLRTPNASEVSSRVMTTGSSAISPSPQTHARKPQAYISQRKPNRFCLTLLGSLHPGLVPKVAMLKLSDI